MVINQDILRMEPWDVSQWCERAQRFVAEACEARAAAGVVVGLSGGVDASVVAALAVRALGPSRVLGVLLPERDSDPASTRLALQLAEQLGVKHLTLRLTGALRKLGVYALAPRPMGLPRAWRAKYVRRRLAQASVRPPGIIPSAAHAKRVAPGIGSSSVIRL